MPRCRDAIAAATRKPNLSITHEAGIVKTRYVTMKLIESSPMLSAETP